MCPTVTVYSLLPALMMSLFWSISKLREATDLSLRRFTPCLSCEIKRGSTLWYNNHMQLHMNALAARQPADLRYGELLPADSRILQATA